MSRSVVSLTEAMRVESDRIWGEFPLCLNRLQTRLGSMKTWFQSLALLSVLRMQCCPELLGSCVAVAVAKTHSYSSDSVPSLGTSICPKALKRQNKQTNIKFKKWSVGVPIVVQQKQIWLGTVRFRVQSLAWLSGLRIQCFCELWCRLQTQLGSGVAVALA